MSRHITTRAQISGYRFGVARAEHALVRRDVRMTHDPMRAQSRALVAGTVLAVLVLAGAAIYGFVRPQPDVRDAQIVAVDGGGMYVLIDGVMHPVPNVASARLILGRPLPVRRVSERSLSRFPRGAAVGIPDAPGALDRPAVAGRSTWTVCEDAEGSAVVVGDLASAAETIDADLVQHAGVEWLLYRDPTGSGTSVPVRARVDRSRVELVRALGLEGREPRTVGAGLLNTFTARPDLRVPEVPDRGSPGVLGLPVGSVVATAGVDGTLRYQLVLADGVQPLSEPAAEMMRLTDPSAADGVRRVAPAAVAALTVREVVPVAHFPHAVPRFGDPPSVLCHRWSRDTEGAATAALLGARRLPVPDGARPVLLASSDGRGPALDRVYLRPGTGEHVVLTGVDPRSPRASTPFYVSDAGVRYRLAGAGIGEILGLPEPVRAPWPMIALLPSGPELSREAAAVTSDGVSSR